MKTTHTFLLTLLLTLFYSISADAQNAKVLWKYDMTDGSTIHGMSDNGKWAVGYGVNDATSLYSFPKLVNLTEHTQRELLSEDEINLGIEAFANDITNDGTIVVGCYNGQPAYLNTTTNKWYTLPLVSGNIGGHVDAVTPDGKYAVGICTMGGFDEVPVMWDLQTNKIVTLTNLPSCDLSGHYQDMTRLLEVSADARYIVGCVSYSYPSDVLYFLYDRETQEWDAIAFDYEATSNRFTARDNSVRTLDGITISPNGEWVAGVVYSTDDGRNPFRYHVPTRTFENFNRSEDLDKGCVTVDNDGTIYAATPAINPSRSLYILRNGIWYGIDEVLKQNYGIDFYKYTGYAATGLCIDISEDCKTMVGIAYITQENYQITLPIKISEACDNVNLLSTYSVSVRNGASIQKLSNLSLEFTRDVEINTSVAIELKDETGAIVRNSLKFEVDAASGKKVNVGFRTFTLEQGKKYSLIIPKGAIRLKGDSSKTNDEIKLEYTGLGATPISMTQVTPVSGSTLGHIDINTNPILFSFSVDVMVKEGAKALLYRNEETEPYASLEMNHGITSESYNMVLVYPTTSMYLYKGNTYRIVIPEGCLTDAAGYSSNAQAEATYSGSYERTIVSDDTYLYRENFEGGMNNVMLYDGDNLTPASSMQAWGFTNSVAWSYAADDDYTNTCAVSHSTYSPSGASNDWMVTPQLSILDDKCTLKFDAQSYRKSCADVLKVYIYATDEVINELDAATVEAISSKGDLVLNATLSPGAVEERLDGDWESFNIPLSAYAGKKVYIAFVNQNDNQSAIFVSNVQVYHAVPFQITLIGVPETVIAANEQIVKGTVLIKESVQTYSKIQAALKDADGTVLQEIVDENVVLSSGSEWNFQFTTPLPLVLGREVEFSVHIRLDDGQSQYEFKSSIQNLAFEPTKRVLLEENTGMGCNNCPMGHLAIERLERLYGDLFIPVAYHVYTGDPLESGMTDYAQYFLGLNAAPTGMVQRSGIVSAPMVSTTEGGVIDYSFTSPQGETWADAVAQQLATATDADLSITAHYDAQTDCVSVNYTFTPAIERTGANVGLLCIVTEDELSGYQSNKFYTDTDVDLGEWKQGGKYSKSTVYPYTFHHVARALYPANAYNGQTGLLPTTLMPSETYSGNLQFTVKQDAPYVKDVMNCSITCVAIDANTGRVINAARAALADAATGIEGAISTAALAQVVATANGLWIQTPASARVTLYDAQGKTLAQQHINKQATIATTHKGLIIVNITTAQSSQNFKVVK